MTPTISFILGVIGTIIVAIFSNILTDHVRVVPQKWKMRRASKNLEKLSAQLEAARAAHNDRELLYIELATATLRVVMMAAAGLMFVFLFGLIPIYPLQLLGSLFAVVSAFVALNFATEALQLAGNVQNFEIFEQTAQKSIAELESHAK